VLFLLACFCSGFSEPLVLSHLVEHYINVLKWEKWFFCPPETIYCILSKISLNASFTWSQKFKTSLGSRWISKTWFPFPQSLLDYII
jgi:hypothetical protein